MYQNKHWTLTTKCDESALDLSTPNPLTADFIVLPASAITLPASDNIPFHITDSGHLLLANFMVERVNEGLVFKQIPTLAEQTQQQQMENSFAVSSVQHQQQSSVELEEVINIGETDSENNEQALLNQTVYHLLKKGATESSNGSDIVLNGHNITTLVAFANRLKAFRLRHQWSQAKLSKQLVSKLPLEQQLVFSQSFLCRFEKMLVTLRAALGAYPHLKRWLNQVEKNEDALDNSEGEEDQIPILLDPSYSSEKEVFKIPVKLLDLRDPTNRNCVTTDDQVYSYNDEQSKENPQTLHTQKIERNEMEEEKRRRENRSKYREGVEGSIVPHSPPPSSEPEPRLEPRRRRKKRIFFNEESVKRLKTFYSHTPQPTSEEYTQLSAELNYPRESVRVWFCNRRCQRQK